MPTLGPLLREKRESPLLRSAMGAHSPWDGSALLREMGAHDEDGERRSQICHYRFMFFPCFFYFVEGERERERGIRLTLYGVCFFYMCIHLLDRSFIFLPCFFLFCKERERERGGRQRDTPLLYMFLDTCRANDSVLFLFFKPVTPLLGFGWYICIVGRWESNKLVHLWEVVKVNWKVGKGNIFYYSFPLLFMGSEWKIKPKSNFCR